jgi:hypothetical protein
LGDFKELHLKFACKNQEKERVLDKFLYVLESLGAEARHVRIKVEIWSNSEKRFNKRMTWFSFGDAKA